LGAADVIQPRVAACMRDRACIYIEAEHATSAERAAAKARIPVPLPASSSRHPGMKERVVRLKQAQRHRGGRVFAGPERAGSGNNEPRLIGALGRVRSLTDDF